MRAISGSEEYWLNLFDKHGLVELLAEIKTNSWQPVWRKIEDLCQKNSSFQNETEKHIFIDVFASYALSFIEPSDDGLILCQLIETWQNLRKLPDRYFALSEGEESAAVYFCLKLRDKIKEWLLLSSDQLLAELPENYQKMLLSLWPQLFLNIFSPLYIIEDKNVKIITDAENSTAEFSRLDRWRKKGWAGFLAASMYFPNDAGRFAIDSQLLIKGDAPLFLKIILIKWMVYIPYFNATMEQRSQVVKYVPELCQALIDNPKFVTQSVFISVVQEIMTGLWRVSYIGGNNLAALSSFGDFISSTINRFCCLPPPVKRKITSGEKIKVGYISRNFFQQAVSYYMINRIIHHNRDKFEIFTYALGENSDWFTDIFKENSEHFESFPDLRNFTPIVTAIIRDKPDILIYADIGMDAATYILAGLKLAPIQCALVGHGTTTGLSTIDYYLSGDFESPGAQEQYREKLIRLPNLGAAQYLPEEPVESFTRADLGIPEEAVVYISCANGIKHRPERDKIYIEILKKAPNAWIVLKPYTAKDGIDGKMAKRLRILAEKAQVSDRLVILPSLGHYRTVLGLLKIADVQLDTYPYGGWTTNLEALYVGLPLVTQEGELSRSRWGAGMLKALGIAAGIARNESEYVDWAVRFACDGCLRRNISKIIKTKAREEFFNGQAAQDAFENVLVNIAEQGMSQPDLFPEEFGKTKAKIMAKKFEQKNIAGLKKMVAVTSIAPRNFSRQKEALATWLAAGFEVVSLNATDEVDILKEEFPEIKFEIVPRDSRNLYKHPYIFFDDILDYLGSLEIRAGGIINSDIYLMEQAFRLPDLIAEKTDNSLVFGSRFEVKSQGAKKGKIYELGFDYFFLGKNVLKAFPKEEFCLGLPWWDYWAALIPIEAGFAVERLVSPVICHISHETAWNSDAWVKLGVKMAEYIQPPAFMTLHLETMPAYVRYLAKRINTESTDIVL